MTGEKGTRLWSKKQIIEIIKGNKASFNGKVLHCHHTYSVAIYPHLADNHLVIYPATHREHLKGWHGLKIAEREVDAKTLMYLKKETSLSLSDIKDRLKRGDYILLYELDNDKGLHHINVLKKELAKRGFTALLFENDEEEESYLFDNLEETYRQISDQCDLIRELELFFDDQ